MKLLRAKRIVRADCDCALVWFQTILLVSSQVKLASIIRRIVWFAASLALSVLSDTGARSEASKS